MRDLNGDVLSLGVVVNQGIVGVKLAKSVVEEAIGGVMIEHAVTSSGPVGEDGIGLELSEGCGRFEGGASFAVPAISDGHDGCT